MFGSEVLEVAIGIVLLFLLVSLICSALQEGLEGILKWRAADLDRGIRRLLNDPNATGMMQDFYNHPLIFPLFEGQSGAKGGNLPSYIPAANFAGALLDLVARGKDVAAATGAEALTFESLRAAVEKITDPQIKRAMLVALDGAKGDIENVKANLEEWFNSAMDRVSGWYKRRTQGILFLLGLTAAIVLNIDTITVAQRLTTDKTLRDSAVAQAGRTTAPAAQGQPAGPQRSFTELKNDLATIGYPIGWSGWWPGPQKDAIQCGQGRRLCAGSLYVPAGLLVLIGWLVTALATMLGAPFWFDMLNKFMVIRSTVKPREKSQEEGSEDRPQTPRLVAVAVDRRT